MRAAVLLLAAVLHVTALTTTYPRCARARAAPAAARAALQHVRLAMDEEEGEVSMGAPPKWEAIRPVDEDASNRNYDYEEEDEDEDDDDEPQTEEEWMEKLRRQQAELLRLRQAISQVREAGGEMRRTADGKLRVQGIIQVTRTLGDLQLQRQCFLILHRMVEDWCGGGPAAVAGFGGFAMQQVLPVCFGALSAPHFNLSNAAALQLLDTIVALQKVHR